MIRALVTCVALLSVIGCQSEEEPVREVRTGFEAPVAQPEPVPAQPSRSVAPITPEPTAPEVVPPTAAAEAEPVRELGAELQAALGTPSDCISDFVSSSPTTIRVSVSGVVRPTGMIIEPSAYGSGLSGAALACIRQRVGAIVLQPLDQTVSSTASAVIEIKYEPPVIVEDDRSGTEPNLENVVHPLPKRPTIPRSGVPIERPTSKPIEGGTSEKPNGPHGVRITGPKPRAIDGYEVEENSEIWDDD